MLMIKKHTNNRIITREPMEMEELKVATAVKFLWQNLNAIHDDQQVLCFVKDSLFKRELH